MVLLPMMVFQAWLLTKLAPRPFSNLSALQLLLFGIVYPAVAGLDSDRQTLYFNLSALVFLAIAAWQLSRRLRTTTTRKIAPNAIEEPVASEFPGNETAASSA
jgi:hypothetical protein